MIIASMCKDVWPYWLMWWILWLLFLILFFCYKPIEVPEISYVDYIKLDTIDNRLEHGLWVSVCKYGEIIDKFYCTEDEKLYWCDDDPQIEDGPWWICGILATVISGWTMLPASWIDEIVTANSWQTWMDFAVYQWENIVAGMNTLLESWITISGLPSKKAGEAWVNVSFNVDKKWQLSFKIVDKDNKYNSTEWTVLIPNNWYIEVPEWKISAFEYLKWRISAFEYLKWKLWMLFN